VGQALPPANLGFSELNDKLLNPAALALHLLRGFLGQPIVDLEFFLGSLIFAGSCVGLGQPIMGFFYLRIDDDGMLESSNGLREILTREIDDPELEVRIGKARV
jgi:hypothetical protein